MTASNEGTAEPAADAVGTTSLLREVQGPLAVTMLVFITVGMFNQLATETLVDRLGASTGTVGRALAAMTIGAIAGRLIGGPLVDRLGSRTGFIAASVLVAVAGVLYALPATAATFLIGRFVHGFGEATMYVCAATTVISRVPAERRSRFLGLLGSAVWGGLSIGPAVAELVGRSERAGLVTIAVACAGVLVGWRTASGPVADTADGPRTRGFPRPALVPAVAVGCYNFAWAAVTGFVIVHLRSEELRPDAALTVYGLAVLTGRLAFGGIPDRLGPRPSVAVGLSMMFCGLTVVMLAPSRPAVLLSLGVFGLGYSMPFPALASLAVDRSPASQRASAVALLGLVYDVFVTIAAVIFGPLSEGAGTRWVFGVALGGIVAGLSVAMFTTRRPAALVDAE